MRIDQRVNFAPLDLLSGVIAYLAIKTAPFSAAFSDWLSMTADVGLAIRHHEMQGLAGASTLGSVGGFELALSLSPHRNRLARIELTMLRNGDAAEIEFDAELTALGIISRLEYMLTRFEVELAQYKRTAADNTVWIPSFRERLGEKFTFEDELLDKRAEMDALEASLAATESDSAASDDLLDLGLYAR